MNTINCVTDLMVLWERTGHVEREDTRMTSRLEAMAGYSTKRGEKQERGFEGET